MTKRNDTAAQDAKNVVTSDWRRAWHKDLGSLQRDDTLLFIADHEALTGRRPNLGTLLMNMDARRELAHRESAHKAQPDAMARAYAEVALRDVLAMPLRDSPSRVWQNLGK